MGFIKEFKEFAIKGNVVDMAVGIIIGAAFGKIVNSFIDDLVMPLVSAIVGKPDFSSVFYALGTGAEKILPGMNLAEARKVAPDAAIFAYGNFITILLNFFLLALVIFIMIKFINKLKRKQEVAAPAEPPVEQKLLTEIRDLLKTKS